MAAVVGNWDNYSPNRTRISLVLPDEPLGKDRLLEVMERLMSQFPYLQLIVHCANVDNVNILRKYRWRTACTDVGISYIYSISERIGEWSSYVLFTKESTSRYWDEMLSCANRFNSGPMKVFVI